jgi:manganese/zinc/iron transport system permease protein
MSAEMWVILTAVLAAVTCGWIGTFLVLRQNAMLGDAISHAVLPGLVIGFLLTSSRAVLPMIIGAAAMGLLTAYLTEVLRRSGRVYGDAALTVVFTLLFAVGVILVSAYAGQIDFDQECVLYGEIAYSPWDRFVVGTTDLGPRAVWILSGALLLNVAFVLLFYKQLKITSFDPQMAQVVGISPRRWHYLLMAMVSLTVVASFELVGAILVVAMLIIPGAVGTLLSQRLPLVLAVSVVTGVIAAVGGYYAAAVFDASIAGFMAVVGGVLFVMAVFGSRALDRLRA